MRNIALSCLMVIILYLSSSRIYAESPEDAQSSPPVLPTSDSPELPKDPVAESKSPTRIDPGPTKDSQKESESPKITSPEVVEDPQRASSDLQNSERDVFQWAMQIMTRVEFLIIIIVTIGGIMLAAVVSGLSFFVVWSRQHKNLLDRVKSWEDLSEKSKREATAITKKLPVEPNVDLKLGNEMLKMEKWIKETTETYLKEIDYSAYFLSILEGVDFDSHVFVALGHYYRHKGHKAASECDDELSKELFKTALRRYEKALENPSIEKSADLKAAVYASKSICHEFLSRFTEALNEANLAIEISERTGNLHYMHYDSKGIALVRLEEYEDAIRLFKTAYNLAKSKEEACRPCFNLACSYTMRGSELKKIGDEQYKSYYDNAITYLNKLPELINEISEIRSDLVKKVQDDCDLAGLREEEPYGQNLREVLRKLQP